MNAAGSIKFAGSPAVDAQIDLNRANAGGSSEGDSFFLQTSLNVSVSGVHREAAPEPAEAAHGIRPCFRAVHGDIEVSTTII
jgi:lipoyl-dependent peroxiredoxin